MDLKFFRLKNGLRTILINKDDFESLTFLFFVKFGSYFEKAKENGLAHFLEHMIFNGSKNFPNKKIVLDELEKIAASFNGGTSYDLTYYYIKSLEKFKERAVFILSDLIKNPLFKKEDIEKEKNIVLEEIKLYEDDPLNKCLENLFLILFDERNWGRRIIGTPKTVTSFTFQKLFQTHQRYYSAKNSLILVIGKIKDFREMIHLLQKHFGDLKAGKEYFLPEFNLKPKLKIGITQQEINQVYFSFGTFKKINLSKEIKPEKNFLHFLIMNRILGEGNNSRLFVKIRENLNLAYYLKTYLEFRQNHLIFFLNSGLNKEKYLEAIRNIIEEIKEIKKNGFKKEEIDIAYETILANLLIGFENVYTVGMIYATSYLYVLKDFKKRDLKKYLFKIFPKKPDYEEINSKIKKFLENNFSFSLIIPKEDSKKQVEKSIISWLK